MKRHLLSVLAVAAFASFAGAQEKYPAQSDAKPVAKSTMKKSSKTHRTTYTSAGAIDRSIDRGGPGYSVHATARDFARADDTRGDDLWHREQMMDAKCGKSRERCGKP